MEARADATLETFPEVVSRLKIRPGQRFVVLVEDPPLDKVAALAKIREISSEISENMAKDGIVTEEQKEAFIQSLWKDDNK